MESVVNRIFLRVQVLDAGLFQGAIDSCEVIGVDVVTEHGAVHHLEELRGNLFGRVPVRAAGGKLGLEFSSGLPNQDAATKHPYSDLESKNEHGKCLLMPVFMLNIRYVVRMDWSSL